MQRSYLIWGILAVLILIGYAYFKDEHTSNSPMACTTEAKLCPDGSYVGRVGPKCEFSSCPIVATTTAVVSTTTPKTILPYNSGVRGNILLGPTCPVIQNPPDPQCNNRPYSTLVTVFRKSDRVHAYAIGESDKEGKFSFSLPPGEYEIHAGESNLPRCASIDVKIEPNIYTPVTVYCDTGIR
jgi:hypothetical protein